MGSTVHLNAGDPCTEAPALELWASGELGDADADAKGGTATAVAAVVAMMLGLAAFFVAFAPPV